MRFLADGPSIPDELLIARDQGRVVFFCGAGVSKARAGLPDFWDLAARVIERLGVPDSDPVNKLLSEAKVIEDRTGVHGVISADRIFGLLERAFLVRDIESAVSEALKPKKDVDLSAHRILIDLATTPEGRIRLVTTNFDRLFDACKTTLTVWKPPRLPDPSRHDEMDGIIYLHGCTNKDYSGSEGDGFILTSSAFGRAYLSEGWVTSFFKEIIDKFVVVFIGYSADDPPVHYLLEALHRREGQRGKIFAFQSGEQSEAAAEWLHKGVTAIPYSEKNRHAVLWDTLEAWALKARNPENWLQSVINLAKKGPENLEPYERGQVAHVVSTFEGARKFAEAVPPPPSEWLCVFDPFLRYAKPGNIGRLTKRGPFIDPFDSYGLDSDIAPEKITPEDFTKKREVPEGAFDAFAPNRLDHHNLQHHHFPAFRGHGAINVPTLPPRLNAIGSWISEVANQPASVWWAAHQNGLHPHVQFLITNQLELSKGGTQSAIQKAWRYLFETWHEGDKDPHREIYRLKKIIDQYGWDSAVVRKYASIDRPYLKAQKNYYGGPKPPIFTDNIRLDDLLLLDVEYPATGYEIQVPNEWLALTMVELRKNLEHTLQLEQELGSFWHINISSIEPDDAPNVEKHGRAIGLSGHVISFASFFSRLVNLDRDIAFQELLSWPAKDDTIFSMLRIWACGIAKLISPKNFDKIFTGLSDKAFWDDNHQRDLLLVLAKRWNKLHLKTRRKIEERILRGRAKWNGENDEDYKERKAREILDRLTWMVNKGCDLSFDLEAEATELRKAATHWKPEYALNAARSHETRVGWVKKDTEYASLIKEPVESILDKALEIGKGSNNFLIEKDPFSGLSGEYPEQAFSALTHAATKDDYPGWAWRTFLHHEARKNDDPRFSAQIAECFLQSPENKLAELAPHISQWLLGSSEKFASHDLVSYKKLIRKLIKVLRNAPSSGATSLVRENMESDWTMWALNSPVGNVAQSLFEYPRLNNLKMNDGFPKDWLALVESLLSLNGDCHRYALVMLSHHLNWLYFIDPSWTESNLLIEMEGSDANRDAFWSGFLWGGQTPNQELYFKVKPYLLAIAKEGKITKSGYIEIIAGIILAGWGTVIDSDIQEKLVTNDEMRDVLLNVDDEFRSRILWQISHWSKSEKKDIAERWSALLPSFLREVWPLQKSVKTPTMSARLCDLAFSQADCFPELSEIILPLVTKIDRDNRFIRAFPFVDKDIVDQHPRETLAIMHAILPDDVESWPYRIEQILDQICEADNSLEKDERLLELKRKWNAR